MPMLGYKRKFKNMDSLKDDVFIINFDLKYSDAGALHINNEIESPYVYSIGHETNNMIDSYLTKDIINDYDRIII